MADVDSGEMLPQREPITDLEIIVGYTVQVQSPTRIGPELAEHLAAYLDARGRKCTAAPRITTEAEARATLQAHRHHVNAPCLQKRAAVTWMRENGLMRPSSEYASAG